MRTDRKILRRHRLLAAGAAGGVAALVGATSSPVQAAPAPVPASVHSDVTHSCSLSASRMTFFCNFTASDTYTLPAGVTSVDLVAVGGAGGTGGSITNPSDNSVAMGGPGGLGNYVTADAVSVTSGETLSIYVAGNGADGASTAGGDGGTTGGGSGGGQYPTDQFGVNAGGGGGGGVSYVNGDDDTLLIAAAGGGGGGSGFYDSKGDHDGAAGGDAAEAGHCSAYDIANGYTTADPGTANGPGNSQALPFNGTSGDYGNGGGGAGVNGGGVGSGFTCGGGGGWNDDYSSSTVASSAVTPSVLVAYQNPNYQPSISATSRTGAGNVVISGKACPSTTVNLIAATPNFIGQVDSMTTTNTGAYSFTIHISENTLFVVKCNGFTSAGAKSYVTDKVTTALKKLRKHGKTYVTATVSTSPHVSGVKATFYLIRHGAAHKLANKTTSATGRASYRFRTTASKVKVRTKVASGDGVRGATSPSVSLSL